MVCYGMALRSIFLTCMPQALIYHNGAKDLLKSCFRISRDILLSKNIFGMTIMYNTTCAEVEQRLPYNIAIQKLFLLKMTMKRQDKKTWAYEAAAAVRKTFLVLQSYPTQLAQGLPRGFHMTLLFKSCSCSKWLRHEETKGRSSGQTPFTLKPKQLALKKSIFNPKKILP